MRFILQDDVLVNLPPDWDECVEQAKTYVERKVTAARNIALADNKTEDEIEKIAQKVRHDAINKKCDVWHAAKDALKKASYGKCWYCESLQDRSDMHVDHFRPKNRVYEASSNHPGYWWLAFDWKNFRYSCTFCNCKRKDIDGGTEGGKQDHFPVITPPSHACSETDPQDQPMLLDPINDSDTKLLTFLSNGFPSCMKKDQISLERVNTSIRFYHLDHSILVRKRKLLANKISQLVANANNAQSSDDDESFRYNKKEIIKLVRGEATYSCAARVYLLVHRNYSWVEEILGRDL